MIERRRFVVGAGLAGVASFGVLRPAMAAEFNFRLAHSVAPTHPLHLRLVQASERIKADTKGRMDLQIFPADQLGSATDSLGQVRSGATDFFLQSAVVLSSLVPVAAISGLSFAFKDADAVWKSMDGALGDYIRADIAKTGSIFAFDKVWDNGYRQITTSNRPIRSPGDLDGIKIRVPPSAMWVSLFKALGASPTTINFNELYSALQTRVVDAQEQSLVVILTTKLYEVQKFGSMTNHMWDGFWLLGNRRNFEALPRDVQAVMTKHLNDAAMLERDDLVKLNVTVRDELKAKGLQFESTNPAAFQDKLRAAGFYAEWKAKFPPAAWNLLESTVGKL